MTNLKFISNFSALIAILLLVISHTNAQQFSGAVYNNSMPSVPGSEITFWNILDANNKNTSLLNYQNLGENKARQDPKLVQKAVIVIHGLGQDPATYMSNMLSALAQAKSANSAVDNNKIATHRIMYN